MEQPIYEPNMMVEHPRMPELGLGKVMLVTSLDVVVFFGDAGEERRFRAKACPLIRTASQEDVFPGLTPYRDEREMRDRPAKMRPKPKPAVNAPAKERPAPFGPGSIPASPARPKEKPAKARPVSQLRGYRASWTRQQAVAKFRQLFPQGLKSIQALRYMDREGRDTRENARLAFAETIGLTDVPLEDGAFPSPLGERLLEVARLSCLLTPDEFMLLEASLADETRANRLLELVRAFALQPGLDSFNDLASFFRDGGLDWSDPSPALAWPFITLFPALAAPNTHFFVRPESTQAAANRWHVNLECEEIASWDLYVLALEMAREIHKSTTAGFGARNLLDTEAFLWIIQHEETRYQRPERK